MSNVFYCYEDKRLAMMYKQVVVCIKVKDGHKYQDTRRMDFFQTGGFEIRQEHKGNFHNIPFKFKLLFFNYFCMYLLDIVVVLTRHNLSSKNNRTA